MIVPNESILRGLEHKMSGVNYTLKTRPLGRAGFYLGEHLSEGLYGAPHWQVMDFKRSTNDVFFMVAQSKLTGTMAVYDKRGNSKLFGGPHKDIFIDRSFTDPDYICARKERLGPFAMYDWNGEIAYGGLHEHIKKVAAVGSEYYVLAKHEGVSASFYMKDGTKYDTDTEMKICRDFFGDFSRMELSQDVQHIYSVLKSFVEKKYRLEVIKALRTAMYRTYGRNEDVEEVRDLLKSLEHQIKTRPERLMELRWAA